MGHLDAPEVAIATDLARLLEAIGETGGSASNVASALGSLVAHANGIQVESEALLALRKAGVPASVASVIAGSLTDLLSNDAALVQETASMVGAATKDAGYVKYLSQIVSQLLSLENEQLADDVGFKKMLDNIYPVFGQFTANSGGNQQQQAAANTNPPSNVASPSPAAPDLTPNPAPTPTQEAAAAPSPVASPVTPPATAATVPTTEASQPPPVQTAPVAKPTPIQPDTTPLVKV